MILSKHFVFIHFPKTGGSFVRELCRQYAPSDWQVQIIDDHPTIQDTPKAYQSLPKFGFIRNPWDWYVSWYLYLKNDGQNEFFNKVSNNGTKNFKDTLMTIFELDFIKSTGLGGYNWYLNYTFGDDPQALQLGLFEHLRDDLLLILKGIVTVPAPLEEAIQTHPPVNVGERKHYSAYYDQELRDLITCRDRFIIEKFGYTF